MPHPATIQELLQSLEELWGKKLWLPGEWSPTLLMRELEESPPISMRVLAKAVRRSNLKRVSYLELFKTTRDEDKERTDRERRLFELFEQSSLMLYFEDLFLRLLEESDEQLEKIMERLAKLPAHRWNEVTDRLGALCFEWFALEPDLYLDVSISDVELIERVRRLDSYCLVASSRSKLFSQLEEKKNIKY